jgi:hypothetical protein
MRLIRFVVLLLLLSGTGFTIHAQDAAKDQMVKSVFNALQKKDKQAYIKLFPDLAAFKRLTTEVLKNVGRDDEMAAEQIKKIQEWTQAEYDAEFVTDIQKEFKEKIENAEEKGIDWAGAVFNKWTEEEASDIDKIGADVKTIAGTIYFTSKGKEFEIRFREIVWSESDKRWYGVDLKDVREKGAKDNDDIGIIKDGINAPAAVDSVYVAPVPAKPVIDAPNKAPAKNKPKKQ